MKSISEDFRSQFLQTNPCFINKFYYRVEKIEIRNDIFASSFPKMGLVVKYFIDRTVK